MTLLCKNILWPQTKTGKAPPPSLLLLCLGRPSPTVTHMLSALQSFQTFLKHNVLATLPVKTNWSLALSTWTNHWPCIPGPIAGPVEIDQSLAMLIWTDNCNSPLGWIMNKFTCGVTKLTEKTCVSSSNRTTSITLISSRTCRHMWDRTLYIPAYY